MGAEAWAIFANHYRFIAHCRFAPETLPKMLGVLHQNTSGWINVLDQSPGRRVWYNFWETRLTRHSSYLALLSYVHQNPVKHGLVDMASDYPWCSARWFESHATRAQVSLIYGMKIDRVTILDNF